MKKWMGIGSLIVGIAAFGFFAVELMKLNEARQSAVDYFSQVWKDDLQLLAREKKLPEGWDRIGRVELTTATELAEEFKAKGLKVPVKLNLSPAGAGDHSLEILLIVLQDPQEMDVVVQYNLLDPEQNLIWELGRTFKLPYPLADAPN